MHILISYLTLEKIISNFTYIRSFAKILRTHETKVTVESLLTDTGLWCHTALYFGTIKDTFIHKEKMVKWLGIDFKYSIRPRAYVPLQRYNFVTSLQILFASNKQDIFTAGFIIFRSVDSWSEKYEITQTFQQRIIQTHLEIGYFTYSHIFSTCFN